MDVDPRRLARQDFVVRDGSGQRRVEPVLVAGFPVAAGGDVSGVGPLLDVFLLDELTEGRFDAAVGKPGGGCVVDHFPPGPSRAGVVPDGEDERGLVPRECFPADGGVGYFFGGLSYGQPVVRHELLRGVCVQGTDGGGVWLSRERLVGGERGGGEE